MQIPNIIQTDTVHLQVANGLTVTFSIGRLDLIHPFISGNKYFKLKYNLLPGKGIITMGGAFSNHLAATAYACHSANVPSIGIIRGEITEPLNPTLQFCTNHNMKLIAVKRSEYDRNHPRIQQLIQEYNHYHFVPEGGDNELGEIGCTEITSHIENFDSFSHIACAIGTGTTFRGISKSIKPHQTCIGIPVLKIRKEEQEQFIQNHLNTEASISVFFDFAGKGYAKYDAQLISFLNEFYALNQIPLDFVYTGKLMMAAKHLLKEGKLSKENKLLVMHTGGLQGNQSLPKGLLNY